MKNIDLKEINDRLNNSAYTNYDYVNLIDNSIDYMKKILILFKSKVIEKYPDVNNRPKDLQERIFKIDELLDKDKYIKL